MDVIPRNMAAYMSSTSLLSLARKQKETGIPQQEINRMTIVGTSFARMQRVVFSVH